MNSNDVNEIFSHLLFEKKLKEFFPKKAFKHLASPFSLCPYFDQGLPRNCSKLDSNYLSIKDGFTDLKALCKLICEKHLLSIYEYDLKNQQGVITIFTSILKGGFGDYFAHKCIKQLIQEKFPSLEVQSILFTPKKSDSYFPFLPSDLVYEIKCEEDAFKALSDQSFKETLKKSSLVIEIPTPLPFWDKVKELYPVSIERIGEYGFIQSFNYGPHSNGKALGLHFLEYGLLFEKITIRPKYKFENTQLFSLFNAGERVNKNIFFSYLYNEDAYICYFFTVLSLYERSKELIFLTLDLRPFLRICKQMEKELKNSFVESIELYFENKLCNLCFAKEGKKIKIYLLDPLSHEDFVHLINESSPPVGIRGNSSFSEAVSLKKPFFYDPLEHNLSFYYSLLSLSKEKFPLCHQWFKIFTVSFKKLASFDTLFKHPNELFKELIKFNRFLKKNYSASPYLEKIIQKHFYLEKFPDQKRKEQEGLALFLEKKLSFLDLIKFLKK
jgi:hypothetical protein